MKKKAVLLIAALMVLLGCGSGHNKPVKITLLTLGNKPVNGRLEEAIKEINKRLVPELGAEFDIRFIEWGNWANRYQLALASGARYFDLIMTSTTWLFAWEIAQRGGFYPMTPEMLKKNAPRTWAEVKPEHWDICTKDGYIWFIPEDQYTQSTNNGYYWRLDWAREGGIEQVTTFEELEAYLDAVKQHHPDIFLGMGGSIEGYKRSHTAYQTIIGTQFFGYYTDDPYTAVNPDMDGQVLIDAAQMFLRWRQKGFWREDSIEGSSHSLFLAGLSSLHGHNAMTYCASVRPLMDKLHPGSDVQFFIFGMQNDNILKDLITTGAMAINPNSKNPELALRVYDYLRNDREIYMLLNYGIEGVDYLMRPDGKLGRPEGWDEDGLGFGFTFWGGRMDKFEPVNENWWDGTLDLIAHLNSTGRDYPLAKFSFDSSMVSAEMASISNVYASHMGLITWGKSPFPPEEAVANFRRDLKAAGYDKVKAELQSQLDAFWAAEQ